MNFLIDKVIDSGKLASERVIFKAQNDDNIGFYGVFKTVEAGQATVSGKIRATHWFPDKDVKKGDLIVLYSKVGINTERKEADGSTVHFFYWGLTDAQWEKRDKGSDAVVLFKIDAWAHKT